MIAWIRDHFSLRVYRDRKFFHVFRVALYWSEGAYHDLGGEFPSHLSLTVDVWGYGLGLVYWPRFKA